MDADALRRSQRRMQAVGPNKKSGREMLTATPSQESDFDEEEDELSTPSADHSEKNMLSILSVR